MLCERCGKYPVSKVKTVLANDGKSSAFLCENCFKAEGETSPPSEALESPCDRCRVREGTVKTIKMDGELRTVSYLCEDCAESR